MKEDALFSPAAERNRDPILRVLETVLPGSGTVLEIASGSGQHAVYFARFFPALRWQPSDIDADALASIRAYAAMASLPNLLPPLRIDVQRYPWPVKKAAAVLATNLIHISPWAVCQALFAGAAWCLPAGAPLMLYGPYLIAGRPTAPSNLAFDESLRARDPRWGVRQLEDVVAEAAQHGFAHDRVIDVPANNFTLVFRKK